MQPASSIESELRDDWHVVADLEHVLRNGRYTTQLFGIPLSVDIDRESGEPRVACEGQAVEFVKVKYGYIWVCIGSPTRGIIEFSECNDDDRYILNTGSVGVAVSGLRAVENFLDLGHLAFVHSGVLGEEQHAEVRKYTVEDRSDGGIIATECRFYQPLASPVAKGGFDVDYIFTVLRPYTVTLHKANPIHPSRNDMIALFIQPVSEERCIAHMLLVYLRENLSGSDLRLFAQSIFGQDKPILENQLPKRLPLGARAEMSMQFDSASIAYRRWLRSSGIRYGAIAAVN